jgi:hypothetical protein
MPLKQINELAKLLRSGQPIPKLLADSLASAIEEGAHAIADTESRRQEMLTDREKATILAGKLIGSRAGAPAKPLSAGDAQVERDFGVPGDGYPSQNAAAEHIAKVFKVSKQTAINRLRESDKATREDIEWLREHGGNE